jgi:RND family efflux transporter MFP subunit
LKKQAEQNLQTIESISANYETSSNDSKEKSIELVRNNLMPNISVYLNALKDLFSANCMSSNSNYDSARTTISTSRNNWSTLSTDLTVKQTAINNSKIALTQATSDLQLSQTGDKSSRVDQQVALVQAAYARLKTAESAASKNILVAPFTGIITSIDLKKGELVSPNKAQVSMISDNNFQIESKVSEIDVAKLSVGATTTVHFDAYGDDVKFKAVVSNISLAAIVSEGVPTYKTIFNFLDKDERIRSGMTANIDAVTKLHENVLTIPAKFLLTNNGKKQVNVVDPKDGSDYTTKNIVIGARGQNGDIEVVDGLKENDILVIEK